MSLSETLTKIKELQPLANEDVDSGPRETMAGRRGRKAQAIESLKRLRREYANDLRVSSAFILVIGDKRNEFTSIATESHKCFSSDPEAFYSELTDKVPAASYLGRESMSNVFDILGRHLEDKMLQLETVSGYPQLIFNQKYQRTLKNRAEFLKLVKEALVEQVGGEIVGLNAISSLVGEAIKRDHSSKYTPILLPTGDEKFALTVANDLGRISSRVYVVLAGEATQKLEDGSVDIAVIDPTNEGVKKALKTISNKLKK